MATKNDEKRGRRGGNKPNPSKLGGKHLPMGGTRRINKRRDWKEGVSLCIGQSTKKPISSAHTQFPLLLFGQSNLAQRKQEKCAKRTARKCTHYFVQFMSILMRKEGKTLMEASNKFGPIYVDPLFFSLALCICTFFLFCLNFPHDRKMQKESLEGEFWWPIGRNVKFDAKLKRRKKGGKKDVARGKEWREYGKTLGGRKGQLSGPK